MRSLTSVIRREVVQLTLVVILIELTFCMYESVTFARIIPQLLFRDSGAYVASRFGEGLAEKRPEKEVFEQVVNEVQRYLPFSEMLLYSAAGDLLRASPGCATPTTKISHTFFGNFRGLFADTYPLSAPVFCNPGEEFLSGAPLFERPGSPILILTRRVHSFSGYMLSLIPMLRTLAASIVAFLLFVLWTRVCVRIFRRFLFGEARMLADRVKEFAGGDLSIRFSTGEFPEYEELATAFNSLAEETSRRLTTLREEEVERRELMAGLAHDLRTPMTAVEGSIALLEKSEIQSEKREEYGQLIKEGTSVQTDLASKMCELARLDETTTPGLEESVSPEDIFNEALRLAGPIAERRNVSLATQFDPETVKIQGNSGLLRRAVMNFLDNAIRHSPAGGTVTAVLSSTAEHTVFEVRDEGSGVVKEADGETRKRPGLGLKIIERISKFHQGTVHIENIKPRGTSARLSLPNYRSIPAEALPVPRQLRTNPEKERTENFANFLRNLSLFAVTTISAGELLYGYGYTAPALAVSALAVLLFGPYLRISTFLTGLSVALLLLALLTSETFPFRVFLASFAFQTALALMISKLSQTTILTVIFAGLTVAIVGVLQGSISSMFLMGVAMGMWMTGIFWVIESAPFARRTGTWMAGLLLIGAGTAAFLHTAAFYLLSVIGANEFTAAEASRVGPEFSAQLRQHPTERDFDESIVARNFLNPLVDYSILDEGEIVTKGGVFDFFDNTDQKLHQLVTTRMKVSNADNERFPISFRRAMDIEKVCLTPGCLFLGVAFPGVAVDALLHREITNLVLPLIFIELGLLWLIITSFGVYWQRLIAQRFSGMKAGLRRYREGNYGMPIGIRGDDEFAVLAASLDSLAERIPQVESEILDKRNRQRRLLLKSAEVIRRGTENISNAFPQKNEALTPNTWKRLNAGAEYLRRSIENIFEITYIERGELRLDAEQISISELVLEEVDTLRLNPEMPAEAINLQLPKQPCFGVTAVEPLIRLLKSVLLLSAGRRKTGTTINISVEPRAEQILIAISDCSTPFSTEIIEGMLLPFERESTEAADMTPDEGAFSLALLARKLELVGGRFEILPREDGMSYGIFVGR